ncbi:MAG: DUF1631 domain-containing protein [Gammaproteobacteria bacterium]|nr:DUF1631 domain-containing protein [Gammaproteobacteria bacterium]
MSAKIHTFVTSKATNKPQTTDPSIDRGSISEAIKQFIHNDDGKDASPSLQSSGKKMMYNKDDVIKALSKLQLSYKSEYTPGQQVNINTVDFKKALLNSMAQISSSKTPKSMTQLDGRTIDFVEMIFGAFLRDKNISDAIKSLLLRLQIPVIKTALLDMKFFHNDKHSARLMLDTIAHIGIGIEDRDNTVYQTMGLIIEQLLRSFDQNIVSFQTSLSSLNRLTKIEQQKQLQNEKLTQKQILQEHARQLVLTELQFYIRKQPLPKSVQPLILKHWSTLMFHRYIRFGNTSEQWLETTALLKQLVDSLKPIKNHAQWNQLNDNYKDMVEVIKDLLNETKQNKEQLFTATNALSRTLERMLEESPYHDISIEAEPETTSIDTEINEISPMDARIESSRRKISQLPAEVRPGVWFEIFDCNDKPVRRLKLSVIILEEAQLIFVDRLGVKVMEKDAAEFTAELINNQSRVLADHSIFDQALSRVITSIAANR